MFTKFFNIFQLQVFNGLYFVRYGILKDKKEPEEISPSKKQSNDKNKKRFRGGNRRGYSPRRRSPYRRNKPYSNYTPRNRGSSRDNQSSLLGLFHLLSF